MSHKPSDGVAGKVLKRSVVWMPSTVSAQRTHVELMPVVSQDRVHANAPPCIIHSNFGEMAFHKFAKGTQTLLQILKV